MLSSFQSCYETSIHWRTLAIAALPFGIFFSAETQCDAQSQSARSTPKMAVRYLKSDEDSGIPTPKPIRMNDAWLHPASGEYEVPPEGSESPPSGPRDVPSYLNAIKKKSQRPPTERPADIPNGLDPDNAPSATEMPPDPNGADPGSPPQMNFPPSGMFPNAGGMFGNGQFGENAGTTIDRPQGEMFILRSLDLGLIRRVLTDREDFVSIIGVKNPRTGELDKPVEHVQITGRKMGKVELTLVCEKGIKRYNLRISPSIALIEGLIARQYPQASVSVTAAGDHVLVLEGEVESPTESESIAAIVQDFLGGRGRVLNNIQVVGVMQVQLEVVIARVDRSGIRRLGINFQYAGKSAYAGQQVGGLGGITPISSGTANTAAAAGGNAFQNVGGAAGSVISPASTVFFGVTDELKQFMMQIEALQQQGVAKVLAKPTLVTLNGRPAEFLVGGEQPFPYQTSAITTPSVAFKKFGTRLNFVPVILGPDKIRLDLVPEVSSVNFTQAINVAGNQVPQFITQRIHTTVEMEPGQSLVLGGLLLTESDSQVQKVPFLGDLPGVGVAFRRVHHDERELELIVIVTPRLVHPVDEEFCPPPLPGQESRRPTDKELYFHGLPEAPHDGRDADMSNFDEGFYPIHHGEPVGASFNSNISSGRATLKTVSDSKPEKSGKPWYRLPARKPK